MRDHEALPRGVGIGVVEAFFLPGALPALLECIRGIYAGGVMDGGERRRGGERHSRGVRRGGWKDAFELLSAADTDGVLTAGDVDALAQAAWWTGRLEEALAFRERAYTAYMKEGDEHSAAIVALTLASDYGFKGALSVSGGWLQRAERLLEGVDETKAHAHLESREAPGQVAGDFDAGISSAEKAYELGKRFDDRDLQAHALVFKGRALTRRGDVADGLKLLDEATATAVSGELSPITACSIYCITISACQGVGDFQRAVELTEAANRWCDRQDVSGFPGACRVHQADSFASAATGRAPSRKRCRPAKSYTTSTVG